MRKLAAGWLIAGVLTLSAFGAYLARKGVPVEPLAVADFNGNGTQDALYRMSATDPRICFIELCGQR